MSRDYLTMKLRDVAEVTQVGLYSQDPVSLDLRGKNFDGGVDTVLINGVASPAFIIMSRTRLIAEVPESQTKAQLRSVKVLLRVTDVTGASSITLDAVQPGQATGFLRMTQCYLRVLLTTPGEDLTHPWLGGGLSSAVGGLTSFEALRTAAARCVATAEQHLTRLQTQNPSLEDAERLQSATMLDVNFVPSSLTLHLSLRLTAMDGSTGNVPLSV